MNDNAPAGYMPGQAVFNFGAEFYQVERARWPQLQHADNSPQCRGCSNPTDYAVGEFSGLEAG